MASVKNEIALPFVALSPFDYHHRASTITANIITTLQQAQPQSPTDYRQRALIGVVDILSNKRSRVCCLCYSRRTILSFLSTCNLQVQPPQLSSNRRHCALTNTMDMLSAKCNRRLSGLFNVLAMLRQALLNLCRHISIRGLSLNRNDISSLQHRILHLHHLK